MDTYEKMLMADIRYYKELLHDELNEYERDEVREEITFLKDMLYGYVNTKYMDESPIPNSTRMTQTHVKQLL